MGLEDRPLLCDLADKYFGMRKIGFVRKIRKRKTYGGGTFYGGLDCKNDWAPKTWDFDRWYREGPETTESR